MHIAAHSITDLRSARSVLKALNVPTGMVFEVPGNIFVSLWLEVQRGSTTHPITGTFVDTEYKLQIDGVQIAAVSKLNYHRYKERLFRVLPPASSTG